MTDKKTMPRLTIASSPHIKNPISTQRIMLNVIIALIPVIIASTAIFGLRVLLNVVFASLIAVLTEFFARKIMKRPQTIQDLSAIVTGILLALNVPKEMPLWQLGLGSIFAIALVKQAFGGIGQNIVNPALITRLALVSSFSDSFTAPSKPLTWFSSLFDGSIAITNGSTAIDAVSNATSLQILKGEIQSGETVLHLLGIIMGNRETLAVGEVCSIAILLGLIVLLALKIISWHIPVSFIGTVAICSLLYDSFSIDYMLLNIFAGGLLIGAVFMATDYATSPLTNKGKLIYGLGCGLITSMIRFWGSQPEGVSYSIIIMNILTPHIDRWTLNQPYGIDKSKKSEQEAKV